MSQGSSRLSGLFGFGAYFFLFLYFFWPLVDFLSDAWPLQPGNIQWRVENFGLLATYLHAPLLAVVLGMTLAYLLNHRIGLLILSTICLMGVAVLSGALALFALDAIQVRSGVLPENLLAYNAGIILTEVKFTTALLALLFMGWGGFKTAGRSSRKLRKSERSGLTAEVLKAQKRDG